MRHRGYDNEIATVLLVEDDPAHAELVMRTLEDHRIRNRIIHLCDGEMALDFVFRRGTYADPSMSPEPDLVLLDLRLPRVDGLEVLRQIKGAELTQHLPVVVLSTSGARRDVKSAYQAHANGYIVKPDDFGKFSKLMSDVTTYWLEANHTN